MSHSLDFVQSSKTAFFSDQGIDCGAGEYGGHANALGRLFSEQRMRLIRVAVVGGFTERKKNASLEALGIILFTTKLYLLRLWVGIASLARCAGQARKTPATPRRHGISSWPQNIQQRHQRRLCAQLAPHQRNDLRPVG